MNTVDGEGPLLKIRNLSRQFGGLTALNEFDLDLFKAEILGLIGPNGAGKSTFFNLISGFHKPTNGMVQFKEQDITNWKPHQIARSGIGRAFQASTLFMRLTAFENVFNGFHLTYRERYWKSFLHTPTAGLEEGVIKGKVIEILEFMGLAAYRDIPAHNLPYGHQKILGVCIALATSPEILLLDEPLTGMHPEETAAVGHLIGKLRQRGLSIILVEHNIEAVMRICDRIVVLNHGRKITEGLPREVRSNQEVIDAYLGTDEED